MFFMYENSEPVAPAGAGFILLGCLFSASECLNDAGGGAARDSWQPAQDAISPGRMDIPLLIVWSMSPLASSACKYMNFSAGTSKYAEPSLSTGTVPSIILSS